MNLLSKGSSSTLPDIRGAAAATDSASRFIVALAVATARLLSCLTFFFF
jgi:hypothetical protein